MADCSTHSAAEDRNPIFFIFQLKKIRCKHLMKSYPKVILLAPLKCPSPPYSVTSSVSSCFVVCLSFLRSSFAPFSWLRLTTLTSYLVRVRVRPPNLPTLIKHHLPANVSTQYYLHGALAALDALQLLHGCNATLKRLLIGAVLPALCSSPNAQT